MSAAAPRIDSWTSGDRREFGPGDSPEDLLRMLISSHTKALREATSAIDLAVMTEVSRRIALSSHVDIYGVVGSAMLAEELQGRLYRIGIHGVRVVGGPQRPDKRGDPGLGYGRDRHFSHWTYRRDDRDAGRGRSLQVRSRWRSPTTRTSPLAELADRSIVTSIYEQFVQPDDLSAKHGQLLVLDLLYLLVAQENFDRSSDKLAASARAVSSHRRPRRTPPRAAAAMAGGHPARQATEAARLPARRPIE